MSSESLAFSPRAPTLPEPVNEQNRLVQRVAGLHRIESDLVPSLELVTDHRFVNAPARRDNGRTLLQS
jgi:hypothetical protein